MKLREVLKQVVRDNVLQELSTITNAGSGNNSARYTTPGQARTMSPDALSGYEQVNFPVADELSTTGDGVRIKVGRSAKYENKYKSRRGADGELIVDKGDGVEEVYYDYDYWKSQIDTERTG